MLEDKRKWPAIRAEEKIKEYRDKNAYTIIDGKSEFAFGFRMCLRWIEEEYDIKPKDITNPTNT